jgi:hypothetical protein
LQTSTWLCARDLTKQLSEELDDIMRLSVKETLNGNILLTGGVGFLGSVCLQQLLALTDVSSWNTKQHKQAVWFVTWVLNDLSIIPDYVYVFSSSNVGTLACWHHRPSFSSRSTNQQLQQQEPVTQP